MKPFTLTCNGKKYSFEKPIVQGILNITPDSFYAGSRVFDENAIFERAKEMIEEGATILDIGGASSRPGAVEVSVEEELRRVLLALSVIRKSFPEILISVDTFHAEVAEKAILAGANIINDISGGLRDPKMLETVARLKAPYILMHMKGTPQNMQSLASYSDVVEEVKEYFEERILACRKAQITEIMLDPGFGFAKTVEQNFTLLNHLEEFQKFDLPVLVGLSRKSMIWKTLSITPEEALNGTTVLNTIALEKGVGILRVHDIKPAMESVKLFTSMIESTKL